MKTPFVVLGDEAFPLLDNLMKPYPRNQSLTDQSKAIFNYRLSRARRTVENAFGILAQVFRIFTTPINLDVRSIEDLVTVTCILHNLMLDERQMNTKSSVPLQVNEFHILDSISDYEENEIELAAPIDIRNRFKDYFNSIGAVEWQQQAARL